jgi:hypothetical protein
MHSLILVSHLFWFSHCAVQAALSIEMMRRRFYQKFPIFVLYTLVATLKSITLLAMNYAPSVTGSEYMYAFTLGDAIMTALGFGVIYEIFMHIFRSYRALAELSTVVFRWTTVVLLAIAIALAWLAPSAGAGHLMSAFFILQRSVNILECGLLLFLFLFSGYFGLPWRSYTFGIALGLGILASVTLATAAVRSQIEPTSWQLSNRVLNFIIEGTNLACVLLWTAFVVAPERTAHAPVRTLPEHDLETWNQELERLL